MFLAFFNKKRRYRLKLNDSAARKKAGGRTREDSTQENLMMNAAGEEFLHKRVYTQTTQIFLRTELSTQAQFLHREVFTQSGSETQKFYTQRFLHRKVFTHTEVLHAEAFTQREVFTQRSFYAQKFLHRYAFTLRRFCAQTRLHRGVFTR